jgi:hypothetical protein
VAFDGMNYLVTWTASTFPDGDIYGARISPSGEVLDPGGFPISTAPGLQDFSALAHDCGLAVALGLAAFDAEGLDRFLG